MKKAKLILDEAKTAPSCFNPKVVFIKWKWFALATKQRKCNHKKGKIDSGWSKNSTPVASTLMWFFSSESDFALETKYHKFGLKVVCLRWMWFAMNSPWNQTCNKVLKFENFAPSYFKEIMLKASYAWQTNKNKVSSELVTLTTLPGVFTFGVFVFPFLGSW